MFSAEPTTSTVSRSLDGSKTMMLSTGLRTLVPATGVNSRSACWVASGRAGQRRPASSSSSAAKTLKPPPPPTTTTPGPVRAPDPLSASPVLRKATARSTISSTLSTRTAPT